METGQVIYVSYNRAILVVAHPDGFAIVELIGDEGTVGVGDLLRADWSELGGGTIAFDGNYLDVYFQGSWGSKSHAVQMAHRMGGGH